MTAVGLVPFLVNLPRFDGRALCAEVDGDIFFPVKGESTREAKKVCRGCDVRLACLEFALDHGERFGVWGGLSEPERDRLLRGRMARKRAS